MAFHTNTEDSAYLQGLIRGKYRKAAVGCWFTSSGKGIPKLIRYEDEDGCLQTIQDIHVIAEEQQRYTGVISRRYRCRSVVEGFLREFILLYHPDTNKWDMIIPEQE